MPDVTPFQYFIDLYWPMLSAFLVVRVIGWFLGQVGYWIRLAFSNR